MIQGIGCDIVSVRRIEKLIKQYKSSFITRILTANEIREMNEYSDTTRHNNKALYLSKRYAAKEAFSKALGTGIGNTVSFLDIEVCNNSMGKPYFSHINNISDHYTSHLSLSDDTEYAIAYVVIELR